MTANTGHFEIDQNFKLFFRTWACAAPKLTMIITHGFAEHSGRYEHVASHFNQQGINVLAFDLPGHGKSDGKRGHANNYDQLLNSVTAAIQYASKTWNSLPILLYGHSMGGNIVLNYLFRKKPELVGLIATNPWIDLAQPAPAIKLALGKMLRNILPSMTQPTELNEHLLSTDPEVGKKYVADPLVQTRISNALGIDILKGADYLRSLKAKTPCPMLIMHGSDDQIIKVDGSKNFVKQISGDVELKVWDGLYHEIHNEYRKQEVFDFTNNWLKNKIT